MKTRWKTMDGRKAVKVGCPKWRNRRRVALFVHDHTSSHRERQEPGELSASTRDTWYASSINYTKQSSPFQNKYSK